MSFTLPPLINHNRYSWASIRTSINGVYIRDITAIEYSREREKELDYGAGYKPKGKIYGKEKCTGKITLNMEVVQKLREIAIPFGGSIVDLPEFTITVSFVPQVGLPLVTHVLVGCEFLKDTAKSAVGDKDINVELELIVVDIQGL